VPAVTPLVVDDFEDGDNVPRDSHFAVWEHYSWSPAGQDIYSWVDSPGFNSNHGMHVRWSLLDAPDGVTRYTGGGLRSVAVNKVVDLSKYTRMVFSHRFEASASCKPVPDFGVSIGCPELGVAYQLFVPVSESWTTVVLPFADFEIPDYLVDGGSSLADCLAAVDGFSFSFGSHLLDGECSEGAVWLDDIYFR
jgi:hypothetical protein